MNVTKGAVPPDPTNETLLITETRLLIRVMIVLTMLVALMPAWKEPPVPDERAVAWPNGFPARVAARWASLTT